MPARPRLVSLRAAVCAATALLLVLGVPAVSGAAPSTAAATAVLSTPELIDRAVAQGEISEDRGILYLAYALSPHPTWTQVPERYIGAKPWFGTLPLKRVRAAYAEMEPGPIRDELGELLDPDAQHHGDPVLGIGTDMCDLSNAPMPFTMESAHFYIEYNPALFGTSGLDQDDYAASLETTWVKEVDTYGWYAPPVYTPDPPPNNKYPIRIDALGPALYGFVSNSGTHAGNVGNNPNTPWDDVDAQASCMVHNADYSAFPGTPQNAMDATSGHEFMHSIHFGWGALTGANDPPLNFSEGAATWMEDEAFDASNDNYNYLYPTFEDDMAAHGGNEYSYWLVWRGLVERFGTGQAAGSHAVMKDLWARIAQSATAANWLNAARDALLAAGVPIGDAYHDFAIAAKFMKACTGGYTYPHCLEEGPAYVAFVPEIPPGSPALGLPPVHGTISAIGGSFNGSIPDNYSLNWVALPTTGVLKATIQNNAAAGGQLRTTLACDKGNGFSFVSLPVVGGGQSATSTAINGALCTGGLVGVVTNQAHTGAAPSASTSRAYTLSTQAATLAPECPGLEGVPGNHVIGTAGNDILAGTSDDDVICGLGGNDTLSGGPGDDLIAGGEGNDTLNGQGGQDTLRGENGNDALLPGADDDPSVDGGAGVDSVSYTDVAGPVTVNLATQTATGAGTDALVGIEGAVGTAGNDVLTGSDGPNQLDGRGGNDQLTGALGTDILMGGAGVDSIDGGGGTDTARYLGAPAGATVDLSTGTASNDGYGGTDTLTNVEILHGSNVGHDVLTGSNGPNQLFGFGGNDQLFGLGGIDKLDGGPGTDTCNGGGQARDQVGNCEA